MKFGKSFVLLLLVLFAFCAVPQVSAAEGKKPADRVSIVLPPVMKLARGIANVAFCVLELPMQWAEVTENHGAIAGITYGTLKGVYFVLVRGVVGVVEIVTFPIPLPDCPDFPEDGGSGYGPILKPEWIVPIGKDWNGFVYDETTIVNPNR